MTRGTRYPDTEPIIFVRPLDLGQRFLSQVALQVAVSEEDHRWLTKLRSSLVDKQRRIDTHSLLFFESPPSLGVPA